MRCDRSNLVIVAINLCGRNRYAMLLLLFLPGVNMLMSRGMFVSDFLYFYGSPQAENGEWCAKSTSPYPRKCVWSSSSIFWRYIIIRLVWWIGEPLEWVSHGLGIGTNTCLEICVFDVVNGLWYACSNPIDLHIQQTPTVVSITWYTNIWVFRGSWTHFGFLV